jgi:predicted dehydrogenase
VSVSPIRWGILGTGRIATAFAEGLRYLPDAELVAVGSRSSEKATAFGERFQVDRLYGSYDALAHDPDIDIVYIATPHTVHHQPTMLCLDAGKAVLCEKPLAGNARQAREMVDKARSRNLFLMEAMWTRCLPLMIQLRERVAHGIIGEPRLADADFGFRANLDPHHRLFDLSLAGGALLDVGTYGISFASMIFGQPDRISGLATIGETGVDEQSVVILGYPDGQLATITSAIRTTTPQEATVMGTEGFIHLHPFWWKPTRLTISRPGHEDETLEVPFEGDGYNYEAAEAMRCLREGRTESTLVPLDETLANMETLDKIRAQWGLHYPADDVLSEPAARY